MRPENEGYPAWIDITRSVAFFAAGLYRRYRDDLLDRVVFLWLLKQAINEKSTQRLIKPLDAM